VLAGWWAVAILLGLWLGRGNRPSAGLSRLLAEARSATSLPEQRPALILLNRLWPLLVGFLIPAGLGIVAPQIPGIAAGFFMTWALTWRHQEKAVAAIEERDGVAFFIERTSPLSPTKLVRTPGFRRDAAPVGPAGA
jgi:hypothetical protein